MLCFCYLARRKYILIARIVFSSFYEVCNYVMIYSFSIINHLNRDLKLFYRGN